VASQVRSCSTNDGRVRESRTTNERQRVRSHVEVGRNDSRATRRTNSTSNQVDGRNDAALPLGVVDGFGVGRGVGVGTPGTGVGTGIGCNPV